MNGLDGWGGMGEFERRLLLSVDAEGYGRADEVTQGEFQEAIPRLLGRAADAARLDRGRWVTQEGGDSLFAVLPAGASEPGLVDAFMRRLDAHLRTFNHNRNRKAWLRLRAAVHFGPASLGANGFVGQTPVELRRILDCAALRAALVQAPDVCLAVGVSERVFLDVVKAGAYTSLRAEEFRHVRVEEKDHRGEAWIWAPGTDVRRLDLGPAPEPAPEPEPEPAVAPAGPAGREAPRGDVYHQHVAPGGAGAAGPGASATVNNNNYGGGRP
ncbi:hypothetical protein OG594_00905 [Streptomyces sp. NBC_01214]|uniref:hypothetical protein n=1 Tax=Streptomyces sp. NBC_01214 TaxID=2903777 RepID=UPI0022570258|nr:hypothetical protein [Streptomyces sp. NBC_01214]MCX4800246.1 hypothetical protein [Streptomyces sp. NBC_01214]